MKGPVAKKPAKKAAKKTARKAGAKKAPARKVAAKKKPETRGKSPEKKVKAAGPSKRAGGRAGPAGKKAKTKGRARGVTTAPTGEKAAVGRPSPYREEFNEWAEKACRLGATDAELGEFFEVCEDTINEWKKVYPEFSVSIKRGKMLADAEVADRLFKRATGYSHKAVKFATFEGMITDAKEHDKHYPPDTLACIFWLKNRRPDLWRDKVTAELTGKDGKPMEIVLGDGVEAAIAKAAAAAASVKAPGGQE